MGLDEGLERIEVLQLLGGDLFKCGGNGSLFDINLLAGDVFKLLDGLGKDFQTD